MNRAADTIKILREARNIIADKKNWTKGAFARDANGRKVPETSSYATCFCSIGAVRKARETLKIKYDMGGVPYIELNKTIDPEYKHLSVATFNDSHSHHEVLWMFDATIQRLEGERA